MKIYVVTDTKIRVYTSMKKLQAELAIAKEELQKVGNDYICNMSDMSYEIAKDVALLERVASQKVFKKDKMGMSEFLILCTMALVILMK